MKKNISAETLISIIIIVAIITILFVGLYKILDYNTDIDAKFQSRNYVSILESNTDTIIQKLDTSNFQEKEIFYIYQTGSSLFLLSGSTNENYRYINKLGENIVDISKERQIYSRFCLVEKSTSEGQSIKCSIKELLKK